MYRWYEGEVAAAHPTCYDWRLFCFYSDRIGKPIMLLVCLHGNDAQDEEHKE